MNGTLTLAASTTVARYFVPRIFIRFHHYHPAVALHLIVGNTEEVLDHLRQQRVGLGLVEGHQRSPGVRLEQFMPDEIVPVCAPRIPDPKLRRAIEGLRSIRDLEALPLIWRESGSGTRAVVESVLKDGGVNPRKLDQRFELGSNEAIKLAVLGWASFPVGTFKRKLRWAWSDRLTFRVFEFSGCFLGPCPAASLEDSLMSSISSPIRFEASYPR